MYGYYSIFAGTGIVFEFVATTIYLWSVVRGNTRPHFFTWFGWSVINAIVTVAQFISGAGAGTFVTAFVCVICLVTAILALFKGEKNITGSDWICFIGSLSAIALWIATSNALTAVVIVTCADTLAFMPTIRKAYSRPDQESATAFAISTIRNIFTLLALQSFLVVNWLYPAMLLLSDGGFVGMLFIRRRQLSTGPASTSL